MQVQIVNGPAELRGTKWSAKGASPPAQRVFGRPVYPASYLICRPVESGASSKLADSPISMPKPELRARAARCSGNRHKSASGIISKISRRCCLAPPLPPPLQCWTGLHSVPVRLDSSADSATTGAPVPDHAGAAITGSVLCEKAASHQSGQRIRPPTWIPPPEPPTRRASAARRAPRARARGGAPRSTNLAPIGKAPRDRRWSTAHPSVEHREPPAGAPHAALRSTARRPQDHRAPPPDHREPPSGAPHAAPRSTARHLQEHRAPPPGAPRAPSGPPRAPTNPPVPLPGAPPSTFSTTALRSPHTFPLTFEGRQQ